MYLITGATGFIGSHIVDTLLAQGVSVRCFVRPTSSLRYLPVSQGEIKLEVAYGDLATGAGLGGALQGIDTVLHVAGATKALSREQYNLANTIGTRNLADACVRVGVPRFVLVSSMSAAGPSPDGMLANEETPPQPISDYGRSKLAAESIIHNSALGPRAVIVRPPAVFGPRDRDFFEFFRTISRGRLPAIGRDHWITVAFVKDLAAAVLTAAEAPQAAGKTYYIGPPVPIRWSELGAMTADLLALPPPRRVSIPLSLALTLGFLGEWNARLLRRPGQLTRGHMREAAVDWTFDASRAVRELSSPPPTPLRDALAATLSWYKQEGWL